jgi:hypothetical protein
MTVAKLYKTTGEIINVSPSNERDFKCVELRKYVGGYFELVPLQEGWLVCNEDGRSLELPKNQLISLFLHRVVLGDCLICGVNEIQ